jgi:di/tripeptidase
MGLAATSQKSRRTWTVNISTSYYQAHSIDEYIRLDVVEKNIERVAAMITGEVAEPFTYYHAS